MSIRSNESVKTRDFCVSLPRQGVYINLCDGARCFRIKRCAREEGYKVIYAHDEYMRKDE